MSDLPTIDAPAETIVERLSTELGSDDGARSQSSGYDEALHGEATLEDDLRSTLTEAREGDKPEPEVEKEEAPKEPEAKEEKPKEVEKPRAPNGKFAKAAPVEQEEAEETGERVEEEKTDAEGKPIEYADRPKGLSPKSHALWHNVPRSVRRDITLMLEDQAKAIAHYQEGQSRYDSIREFDDAARSNGRELRETLTTLSQIEDDLQANPLRALQMVLNEAGPRTADGRPLSLYEVARHIVEQGPDNFQRLMQPPQQQQPREDPRVAQLQAQVQQMETQHLTSSVIAPFRESAPRFDELEGTIVQFLQSGMIDQRLSPAERLQEAYDMAERLIPASTSSPQALRESAPDAHVVSSGGTKSIKSSPGSVTPPAPSDDDDDLETSIRKNLRKVRK